MVEVEISGAFNANSVGMERSPFPLSFSVRDAGGSWQMSASAARARELTDVFCRGANDTVLIVDVATNSFLDEDYEQWPTSSIATEQGVGFTVHPIGEWATPADGLGEEIVAVHRDSLPRFLDGWSPYELSLIDVPTAPTQDQLDEIALVLGTADLDEPVLPRLKGSRFWYSGHDDCYVFLESTDPTMPASLLSRLLALMAGSALVSDGTSPSAALPEPDIATLAPLLRESPHWIGVIAAASPTLVTIHLSALPQRWRLGQGPPGHVDHTAVLDVTRDSWEIVPAADSALQPAPPCERRTTYGT
ncbi:hypothetical protein [Streptomyces xanthophaeus]